MSAGSVLLVLSIPPALEEQVVDWLLESNEDGFSSVQIRGHSSQSDHLSVAERVAGRQRRLQFQIQLPSETLDGVLGRLAEQFRGTDTHYWVLPVLGAGRL